MIIWHYTTPNGMKSWGLMTRKLLSSRTTHMALSGLLSPSPTNILSKKTLWLLHWSISLLSSKALISIARYSSLTPITNQWSWRNPSRNFSRAFIIRSYSSAWYDYWLNLYSCSPNQAGTDTKCTPFFKISAFSRRARLNEMKYLF